MFRIIPTHISIPQNGILRNKILNQKCVQFLLPLILPALQEKSKDADNTGDIAQARRALSRK